MAQITKNGPAYKTDLKEGDIITQIDGNTLNTMNDLRQYIYTKKPKVAFIKAYSVISLSMMSNFLA